MLFETQALVFVKIRAFRIRPTCCDGLSLFKHVTNRAVFVLNTSEVSAKPWTGCWALILDRV